MIFDSSNFYFANSWRYLLILLLLSIPSPTSAPNDHFMNINHIYVNDNVFYFLDGDFFTYTRHEPIGVCGQIIPVSWSPI